MKGMQRLSPIKHYIKAYFITKRLWFEGKSSLIEKSLEYSSQYNENIKEVFNNYNIPLKS